MSGISRPGAPDLMLLLLVAVIWGSSFTAIKLAVPEIGAMWTATIRVFIGFLALLPFFIFKPALPTTVRIWGLTCAAAFLSMVLPFIMISWAMKHVEAGVGSLLLGTAPFIAMVIGHFTTDDERISPLKLLAVAFAVSGIMVLVGPEAVSGVGSGALLAQAAVVASGACYVISGFVMRRIDLPPIAFTAITMAVGSAMLIAISLITAGLPNTQASAEAVYALIWLGLFPTGFAYVMRYFLVKRVGVSTFALAMNTVPVFGILIGALWLGEVIELTTILSLMLILCGLWIARLGAAQIVNRLPK